MAPTSLGSNDLYSGSAGPYTREPGYLAYYEICEKLRNGWTSVWDDEAQVPYAYGDGDWVGYDNQRSIGVKVNMAKSYGLAGIMWWAVDIDDFDGLFCNQGKYPLMTYAKNVLLSDDPVPTILPQLLILRNLLKALKTRQRRQRLKAPLLTALATILDTRLKSCPAYSLVILKR